MGEKQAGPPADVGPPILTKEEAEALGADFPEEAYKPIEGGRHQGKTSLRAEFAIERLNQVFGIGGWRYEVLERLERPPEAPREILVTVRLHVGRLVPDPEGGLQPIWVDRLPPITAYGGVRINKEKSSGEGEFVDAFKGALTSGIKMCAAKLGIGNQVRKGLIDPPPSKKQQQPPSGRQETPAATGDQAKRREYLDVIEKAIDGRLVTVDACKAWLLKVKKYSGMVLDAPTELLRELQNMVAKAPKAVMAAGQAPGGKR